MELRFQAFTAKANGRLREIITECEVSLPLSSPTEPTDTSHLVKTRALWDTGATSCAITKEIADSLGLSPIDKVLVSHADGNSYQNVYLISLILPNKVRIVAVRATECVATHGKFGLIIGMDVICLGDFSITNVNGITVFSFRIPSIKEIDYVQEANNLTNSSRSRKVGRNEPCPCGSGKKYKQCHGKHGRV